MAAVKIYFYYRAIAASVYDVIKARQCAYKQLNITIRFRLEHCGSDCTFRHYTIISRDWIGDLVLVGWFMLQPWLIRPFKQFKCLHQHQPTASLPRSPPRSRLRQTKEVTALKQVRPSSMPKTNQQWNWWITGPSSSRRLKAIFDWLVDGSQIWQLNDS